MKVVVFGTGMIYQQNSAWIPVDDIVTFIDNDSKKQGSYLNGVQINAPEYILHISYDKIILMSTKQQEMKNQLLDMGIAEESIWTWKRYEYECLKGTLKLYCYHEEPENTKGRILVISQHLGYNGGAVAAIYAVKALQMCNYQVVLAAPSGDKEFIEEMSGPGRVNIIICPTIYYSDEMNKFWIKQFDVVIVNLFPMISCACEIGKFRPVLWWMHETKDAYPEVHKIYPQYDDISKMEHINIAAVSEIAKNNFELYYPGKVRHIIPYGIPDEYEPITGKPNSEKITFAIIGLICERKAQQVFIQAVMNFSKEELKDLEFLIIGPDYADIYYREVKELADEVPQIELTGQLTREEIKMKYRDIDVVVCASMEECLPITMTEGMMYGKVCIATDRAGMEGYITHGENGFICRAGDAKSLWNSMKWIVEHRNQLQSIRNRARETYLKYFSMTGFGERLEKFVVETERIY